MFEEDTPAQAAAKGDYLMKKLKDLQARFPHILCDVTGQGLLIGLRFPSSAVGYQVASGLFKRRVLTAGTLISAESIRIEPALNVPWALLDEMLGRLEETLVSVNGTIDLSIPQRENKLQLYQPDYCKTCPRWACR
jgi:putrescine aminotransferase